MPTSTDRPKQPYHHGDLRNALVEAGVELAREGGLPAVVLREAARRVGVSPTAAYRHFDALPDLVNAVAVECLAALARSMEAELARCRPRGDGVARAFARVRAIGRGYVHFALAQPGLFEVAFAQKKGTVADADAAGDSGLSAYELLERSLDELIVAGGLIPELKAPAATTSWAAVHGLSLLLLGPMAEVPPTERETMIEATLRLVGTGVLTRE